MKQDEYLFNPDAEWTHVPDELIAPREYFPQAPEEAPPAPEYGARFALQSRTAHEKKKRLLFMPVAAVIAALSILFASQNSDPLGSNFLAAPAAVPASTTPPAPSVSATPAPGYTDAFPLLPNLDPDFSGAYAWAEMGSEEYLRVDDRYMHAGSYYTDLGVTAESAFAGAKYDKATNTLTLNNYHGTYVNANLMGNGFTIELIGDNSLDYILMWGAMYGGSVTFTGTGTLTLNESGTSPNGAGLYLECEDSSSCIMFDRNVTVDIYGSPAVLIHRTMLEQSVYALSPVALTGGTVGTGEFVIYTVNVTDENGNAVLDSDGNPVTRQITVKDLAAEKGVALYDCSVLDENGTPSGHALFAPEP